MSFIDSIRNEYRSLGVRPQLPQIYKAASDNMPAWLQASGEAHKFDMLNSPESQARLYAQLSWIQTAIHSVATAAITSSLKIRTKKGVDGEEQDVDNHEFETLFNDPNPDMSGTELLEATVAYRALSGNAYWWLNRKSEKEKPDEIWIVSPQQLRPIPDGKLFVRGYMYDPGDGNELFLEPWEIVHFKRFNPMNMYVGLSAVEALQLVSQGDIAAQQWNTNYFAKDNAKLPGALAFADPIEDDAWKTMRSDIESNYGGTKRKLMMLRNAGAGGVQWINMAVSQREMEFLNGRQFNKEEIFSALAPGLVSILDKNATEANATAGKNTFIEFGVWPHLVHIASKITKTLNAIYGDGLIAEFEDIRITDRSLTLAEQAAFSSVHTIDEIRAKFYNNKPIGDERGTLLVAEVIPLAHANTAAQVALDTPMPPQDTPAVTVAKPAALLTDGGGDKPATDGKDTAGKDAPPSKNDLQDKAATAKALMSDAIKAHTSGMVALFMPQEPVDSLLVAQAMLPLNSSLTPADEFHVTLAMLGKVADMDTNTTNAINNALYDFAEVMPPLTGRFNGIGRFQGVGDGGADALYVTFDSKELQDWRFDLIARLRNAGVDMPSEHGFIPHITLGYVPPSAVTPLIYLPLYDIRFDEVWLALGDSQQSFRLKGIDTTGMGADNGADMMEEIKRFKKWLRKRNNPDVSKFSSDILTNERKAQIIESMTVNSQAQEDGADHHFFTIADGVITRDANKANFTLIDFGDENPEEALVTMSQEIEQRSAEEIRVGFQNMMDGMFPEGSADDSPEKIVERVKKNAKATGKVKDALIKALQESTDLGVSLSATQLGDKVALGFDWTLVLGEARDWAKNHAGELIKQINETSKTHVQNKVSQWFDKGDSLDKLISDLEPLFGASRAEVIAVTEATRAAAMGQHMSLMASGVCDKIIWQTTVDELICDICGPRNETTSALGKPDFGGIGLPPAHPRCRCFVRPVID